VNSTLFLNSLSPRIAILPRFSPSSHPSPDISHTVGIGTFYISSPRPAYRLPDPRFSGSLSQVQSLVAPLLLSAALSPSPGLRTVQEPRRQSW
jgi:hypothetical protein